MAKEYTPSGFVKKTRDEWRNSANMGTVCSFILDDLRDGDKDLRFWRLDMPRYIPVKYRARMESVWREMLVRMAFEYANHIGYAERFQLSQKIK